MNSLDHYTSRELRHTTHQVLGYDPAARSAAVNLYAEAETRGMWLRLWNGLRGRSSALSPLEMVDSSSIAGYYSMPGVQWVALDSIIGSRGRPLDFDRSFFPRRDHTRERWLSVADLWYRGVELPPVSLVKVADEYFVLDGHHRVSVARAFGATAITALVTVWILAGAGAPAVAPADRPISMVASGQGGVQELSNADLPC